MLLEERMIRSTEILYLGQNCPDNVNFHNFPILYADWEKHHRGLEEIYYKIDLLSIPLIVF